MAAASKKKLLQLITSENECSIRTPIFSVGTVRDHVAPWKSVYKILLHKHSNAKTKPPTIGSKEYRPTCDAPCSYVRMK